MMPIMCERWIRYMSAWTWPDSASTVLIFAFDEARKMIHG